MTSSVSHFDVLRNISAPQFLQHIINHSAKCVTVCLHRGAFPSRDSNGSDRASDIMRIICDSVCQKQSPVLRSGFHQRTDRRAGSWWALGWQNMRLNSLESDYYPKALCIAIAEFFPLVNSLTFCSFSLQKQTGWKRCFLQPVPPSTICYHKYI